MNSNHGQALLRIRKFLQSRLDYVHWRSIGGGPKSAGSIAPVGSPNGGFPELNPLAAYFDDILVRSDGLTLQIACFLSLDAHDGLNRLPPKDLLERAAAECSRYTGTIARVKQPVLVYLIVGSATPFAQKETTRLASFGRKIKRNRQPFGINVYLCENTATTVTKVFGPWLDHFHRQLNKGCRFDTTEIDREPTQLLSLTDRTGTPALIYALACAFVGIFALQAIQSAEGPLLDIPPGALVEAGGLTRPLVFEDHQYFRLLSAAFLHGDILHILFNLIAFVFTGSILERLVGRTWTLTVFLVSAAAGGAASLLFLGDRTVSVGASGAVMGLFGAFLMLSSRLVLRERTALQSQVVAWMIPSLLPLSRHSTGTDYAAHIGGALAGILCGWMMLQGWPATRSFASRKAAVVLSALVLGLLPLSLLSSSAPPLSTTVPEQQLTAEELERLAERVQDLTEKVRQLNATAQPDTAPIPAVVTEPTRTPTPIPTAESLRQKADRLYAGGDFTGSAALYSAWLEQHPKDEVAHFALGDSLATKYARDFEKKAHKREDLDLALAHFSQAIQLAPNYAAAFSQRGHVYFTLGAKDSAKGDYDRAVMLDPKFDRVYFNRAYWHEANKQYQEALRDYQRYIELTGNEQWRKEAQHRVQAIRAKLTPTRAAAAPKSALPSKAAKSAAAVPSNAAPTPRIGQIERIISRNAPLPHDSSRYGGSGAYDATSVRSRQADYSSDMQKDLAYYRERRERERELQALEDERARIEVERRRVEEDRRKLAQERERNPAPSPRPAAEHCPAGFSPSEQKCTQQERRRGCQDIRLPGGLGCVKR